MSSEDEDETMVTKVSTRSSRLQPSLSSKKTKRKSSSKSRASILQDAIAEESVEDKTSVPGSIFKDASGLFEDEDDDTEDLNKSMEGLSLGKDKDVGNPDGTIENPFRLSPHPSFPERNGPFLIFKIANQHVKPKVSSYVDDDNDDKLNKETTRDVWEIYYVLEHIKDVGKCSAEFRAPSSVLIQLPSVCSWWSRHEEAVNEIFDDNCQTTKNQRRASMTAMKKVSRSFV